MFLCCRAPASPDLRMGDDRLEVTSGRAGIVPFGRIPSNSIGAALRVVVTNNLVAVQTMTTNNFGEVPTMSISSHVEAQPMEINSFVEVQPWIKISQGAARQINSSRSSAALFIKASTLYMVEAGHRLRCNAATQTSQGTAHRINVHYLHRRAMVFVAAQGRRFFFFFFADKKLIPFAFLPRANTTTGIWLC